jgi:endonuclease/exonuclease/phosphatase family metal-dependent hydrolase
MRLVVYNIRYGAGVSTTFHLPLPFAGYMRRTSRNLRQITEFIKALNPDIVGLIEVDSGSFRSNRQNQAATIADALDHFHIYESKYETGSPLQKLPLFNKQANAFLTSNKVHAQRFHYFSKGVKRLVIELEIEQLTIFLVHLSLKYRHRQYQLNDLYALVKDVQRPVIVAGDFNPFWGDREISLFLAATGLKNANERGLASHPSWQPRRQLDFILYSPGITVSRFEVPRVTFSDHLPLVCDFEIRPGP